MEQEDKLFLAKTRDLFDLCDKYGSARFSDFIDQSQKILIEDNIKDIYGYHVMFYGGYEDCERCLYGVFPEWEEERIFPISVLKISYKYEKELSHRDYLGSIMSTGIERTKVGDILVGEKCAYIFLKTEIAEYVMNHIAQIGRVGVRTELISNFENELPKPKYEEHEAVCASLRLDSVAGAAWNLSRQVIQKMILGEKVKQNHRMITNTSVVLKQGDLISVSGYGRFILSDIGGETRKGRLHITIKKII